VAEALETLHASRTDAVASELAHHWAVASGADHRARAAHYARRAAAVAYDALAPDDACLWYRRVLELIDGTDLCAEAEVHVRLAEAEKTAGLASFESTQLSAARLAEGVDDVGLMAEALLMSARFFYVSGAPANPEKIDLLERCMLRCGPNETALRARLDAELAVELFFTDEPRRGQAMESARASVDSIDDASERIQATVRLIKASPLSVMDAGVWRDAQARMDSERRTIAGIADPRVHLDLLQIEYLAALALGDRRAWDREMADLRSLAERTRHPEVQFLHNFAELLCALIDGRIADVEERSERTEAHFVRQGGGDASKRPSRNQVTVERELQSVRFQVALARGKLHDLIEQIRLSAGPIEDVAPPKAVRARLALALAEIGCLEEARLLVKSAGRFGFSDVPDDSARGIALAFWASAAANIGDRAASVSLLELLRPHADLHVGSGAWYLGSNAHYIGRLHACLGDLAAARSSFHQAATAHDAFCTPGWLAATLTEWAVVEARAGSHETSVDLAQRALHVIGTRPLERWRHAARSVIDGVSTGGLSSATR